MSTRTTLSTQCGLLPAKSVAQTEIALAPLTNGAPFVFKSGLNPARAGAAGHGEKLPLTAGANGLAHVAGARVTSAPLT